MHDANGYKWTLAACRVNAGLTQVAAAKQLHISTATLNAHENGKILPTHMQLMAYSQLYDVNLDVIKCKTRN